jgi:hypothetical protein
MILRTASTRRGQLRGHPDMIEAPAAIRKARGWTQASDHVPVMIDLK